MTRRFLLTLGAIMALLVSACGPMISERVRWDSSPYDQADLRQEKDGLVVENKNVKELPQAFMLQVQSCTESGQPATDEQGAPTMEETSFAVSSQTWYQVAITNNTDHVIRLNSAVIRLFDPAGNQYEPLTKDDVLSAFQGAHVCLGPAEMNAVKARFASVKVLDRNAEILPGSTITAWLAFAPTQYPSPGVWKLALYEIPVATNEAGQVSKTTRFELREVVKKFVETVQDGQVVASKEVTD